MKLLYSREQIDERIAAVAAEINKDYAGKEVLMVGVLKGCMVFMAHLLVEIDLDVEIDFMTVSSYGEGTESGDLRLVKDLDTPVKGRHVILVEDIVDTGKTVDFVQNYLKEKGADSVELVSFVEKSTRRNVQNLVPKYYCFDYDQPEFLVGFGFDLGEKYRNLPAVYQHEYDGKN
jgi:hypoxanthine phosphoribosyltransferase